MGTVCSRPSRHFVLFAIVDLAHLQLAIRSAQFEDPLVNILAGVAVKGIIQMCQDVGNMQTEKRKGSVEVVATHIRDSLRIQQQLIKGCMLKKKSPKLSKFAVVFAGLFRRGTYLNCLYLLVKLLYLLQVAAQFVLLNNFLGTSYTFWGFEILRDLSQGLEWHESGHFPRVTMCDFEVRVLGNKHRHTVGICIFR